MAASEEKELLFSYGTLQLESVQLATFGRLLTGSTDKLPAYSLCLVEIDDPDVVRTSGQTHHPIIKFTGNNSDVVEGMVFQISRAELASADEYEVDAYKRVAVRLVSGRGAWVYVDVQFAPPDFLS